MQGTIWAGRRRWAAVLVIVAATLSSGQAQPDKRWELGGQLVIADFRRLGEVPGGFGARSLYNFNDHLAVDAELVHFPDVTRGPSRVSSSLLLVRAGIRWPHGETEALAGLRAGFRMGGVGVFAKARPGIVRLTDHQTEWLTITAKTRAALDLGWMLELYPTSRLVIRFDVGHLYMPLGERFVSADRAITSPPWNLQCGIGFAVRF